MTFDLKHGLIFLTLKNVQKIVETVSRFLSVAVHTAQSWESLLGVLGSQDRFIPWSRFHLRPIQLYFLDSWRPSTGKQTDIVPLPDRIRPHLSWWLNQERLLQGIPLEPPEVDVKIFMDASTAGWGAHLDGHTVQGAWTVQESSLHINVLEMRAVKLALLQFDVSPGANILVATDNATVVAYINKEGGTRSQQLWLETVPHPVGDQEDWRLRARHIPGRLNVIADQLSRRGRSFLRSGLCVQTWQSGCSSS